MNLAERFLARPPGRRALAFEQAAAGRAGQAVMLDKDGATARPMFMSEPPPFAELVQRLAQAEHTLNPP
jgi:hypothetical protein